MMLVVPIRFLSGVFTFQFHAYLVPFLFRPFPPLGGIAVSQHSVGSIFLVILKMLLLGADFQIISVVVCRILIKMMHLTTLKPITTYFRECFRHKTMRFKGFTIQTYQKGFITIFFFIHVDFFQYLGDFVPNPSKITHLIIRIILDNPPYFIKFFFHYQISF